MSVLYKQVGYYYKVQVENFAMLIIPSKQLLLITAQQSKQVFLFDSKTTSVLTKFHSEPSLQRTLAYYPPSNQFLTTFKNKTFINIYSTDCQQPVNKVSTIDLITVMQMSKDKNVLFAGSANGSLYVWEMPSGILIKKMAAHSSEVKRIVEYKPGYLMTCSSREIKFWPLLSLYIETERSTPIKTINSVLDIISVEYVRNVIFSLTSKSLVSYIGGNQHNAFVQLTKQDMEYPTAMCVSMSHVYVGDCKGEITVGEVATEKEEYQVGFGYDQQGEALNVNKLSKKFVLKSENKHPITCMVHMKTLPYLISGNTEGDVCIWQSHALKKSVKLFKTSIKFIFSIPKPIEQKIAQSLKIRPLAKYEQNKQTQPLEVDIERLVNEQEGNFKLEDEVGYIEEEANNELILSRILQVLNRPQEMLRGKVSQLEEERERLIKANLHYSSILSEETFTKEDDIRLL